METYGIEEKFRVINAGISFESQDIVYRKIRGSWIKQNTPSLPVKIDVVEKKGRESFVIQYWNDRPFELTVMEASPKLRHLLLLLKYSDDADALNSDDLHFNNNLTVKKAKFLCGFDERHFFTCAIPEEASVSTIHQAWDALKPDSVSLSERRKSIKAKKRHCRKNKGKIRQGEWFFVPASDFTLEKNAVIRRNEPLSRGAGSKPHIAEEACTLGGETVYFHPRFAPGGVLEPKMKKLQEKRLKQGLSQLTFQIRTRNARVFARGKVRHPDHKTIVLSGWHEVFMNNEHKAAAAPAIVFLD